MCRSVRGGTLAASRPHVGGVMRCAGVYGRLLGGARQAPLLRSMQALAQWLYCAPCVLHRPGVSSSARVHRHPKFRMLNFA